jgi:hypothetical protein
MMNRPMCDKCVEIDKKIKEHRGLAAQSNDPDFQQKTAQLVRELINDKDRVAHCETREVSPLMTAPPMLACAVSAQNSITACAIRSSRKSSLRLDDHVAIAIVEADGASVPAGQQANALRCPACTVIDTAFVVGHG